MDMKFDEEWFDRMSKREGDLEIGAGRRGFPPAYDGCRCACHRLPMTHVVACCHPSKEEQEKIRKCLEVNRQSLPPDQDLQAGWLDPR